MGQAGQVRGASARRVSSEIGRYAVAEVRASRLPSWAALVLMGQRFRATGTLVGGAADPQAERELSRHWPRLASVVLVLL